MNNIQIISEKDIQERNANKEYIIQYQNILFTVIGKIEKIKIMTRYRYSILLIISTMINNQKKDIGYIRIDYTNNINGQYTYWCSIGAAVDSHGPAHPNYNYALEEKDFHNLHNEHINFNNTYIQSILDWGIKEWKLEANMESSPINTMTSMEI